MPSTNGRMNLESRKGKYIILIVWVPQGRCESQSIRFTVIWRQESHQWSGESMEGGRLEGLSSKFEQPETVSRS